MTPLPSPLPTPISIPGRSHPVTVTVKMSGLHVGRREFVRVLERYSGLVLRQVDDYTIRVCFEHPGMIEDVLKHAHYSARQVTEGKFDSEQVGD